MTEHVVAYHAPSIEHGTALLRSASHALLEAQNDLMNVNNLLAEHMHGQFHESYRLAMINIERPLQHLAETVGMQAQVVDSITADALALDSQLASG
jgi:hypothetical protein